MHRSALNSGYYRAVGHAAALCRLWNGAAPARRTGPAPRPKLELFEYEASPWCRRVRETLCVLDLEVLVRPTPRETLRVEGAYSAAAAHKPAVSAAEGRLLFPFLVDHTAGVALNQSADICAHLWSAYGDGVVERPTVDAWLNGGLPAPLDFVSLAGPSGLRPWPHAGLMMAPTKRAPEEPLVLHGCEPDMGCRLVREKLCMLQLPYRHVPRPIDAPLPHLEDPNTGWSSFGAAQALEYLEERYQAGEPLPWLAPVPSANLGEARISPWVSWLYPR